MWTLSALATPFFIRSSSLPGVAITTCTKERQRGEGGKKKKEIWSGQNIEIHVHQPNSLQKLQRRFYEFYRYILVQPSQTVGNLCRLTRLIQAHDVIL